MVLMHFGRGRGGWAGEMVAGDLDVLAVAGFVDGADRVVDGIVDEAKAAEDRVGALISMSQTSWLSVAPLPSSVKSEVSLMSKRMRLSQ